MKAQAHPTTAPKNAIRAEDAPAHVRKMANIYLRSLGRGYRGARATHIVCSTIAADMRIHANYSCAGGYRKITTNEYVPKKYRRNFGWKNTYYQLAINVVAVPVEFWA